MRLEGADSVCISRGERFLRVAPHNASVAG